MLFNTKLKSIAKSDDKLTQIPVEIDDKPLAIKLMQSADDIDQDSCRRIQVESFIGEYEKYLQTHDIEPGLTSWRGGEKSVQKYYEDYFAFEYEKFAEEKLPYWVCAYLGDKLVGWATFECEVSEKDAVYINLLMVDPEFQRKGIGEQLVYSLMTLGIMPDLRAMHVLLREKNRGGKEFYEKIGFKLDRDYKRENFVDGALLVGITWKNPALVNSPRAHANVREYAVEPIKRPPSPR